MPVVASGLVPLANILWSRYAVSIVSLYLLDEAPGALLSLGRQALRTAAGDQAGGRAFRGRNCKWAWGL